jgi:hypothetical protein
MNLAGASSFGTENASTLSYQLNMPLPVTRSYDTNLPATFASSKAYGDYKIRDSVWSCKPDLTKQSLGVFDNAWTNFYNSIPANHNIYVTIWHEPDNNVRAGKISLPLWQKAWMHWLSHFINYQMKTPKPNIKSYICLTNGAWRWSPQTNPDDYCLSGGFDVFGLDVYQDNTKDWLSAQALFNTPFEYAASKYGVKLGVPEFGAVADTRRSGWISDTFNWWSDWSSLEFVNYWTDPSSFDLRNDPTSLATLRSNILRKQVQ